MMKGSSVALLVSLIGLVGCAGRGGLPFKNAVVVDHLEGNYQRLARCTYQHLARQQAQLSMSDLREQETVRIALTKAPQTHWELSFVNEDGGRAAGSHVRLFPKRAHPRIGSRVRGIDGFKTLWADDTGVCFIPRDVALEMFDAAEQKAKAEAVRCKAIDDGVPVPDIARATYGEK